MAWWRRKSSPKLTKKPASSPVFFFFFCNKSLSLHSLSPCSQRLQATLPPARLPPSPPHLFLSTESTFFFLHNDSSPSTPSFSFSFFSSIGSNNTDSSTDAATSFRATTRTTSNLTPGRWHQLLLPPQGCLPLHSAGCNCKVAYRTWTYCSRSAHNSFHLGQASSGPDQMFGPGPAPKKERKKVCWADIGPIFLGPISAHCFWVYVWPSHLGRPSPPVLIIFI